MMTLTWTSGAEAEHDLLASTARQQELGAGRGHTHGSAGLTGPFKLALEFRSPFPSRDEEPRARVFF